MKSHMSRSLGVLGEDIAAHFLEKRGLRIVERNVFVDRDEIDIVYEESGEFSAVEVKTSSNGDDPLDAISDVKMYRVRRAVIGYRLRIVAVDAITVMITPDVAEIRWLRGIL